MDSRSELERLKAMAAQEATSGGLDKKMMQLKSMATKGGKRDPSPVAPVKVEERQEEPPPESMEELLERIEVKIVSSRHFRTGKVDKYGHVVGVGEYPEGMVPHVHQDHYYDSMGRVIKFQKYEKDFSRPLTRYYFYEGESDKLSEGVWLDRYGKIDNIHRYLYDEQTGLMIHRAEYNREGEVFYQIFSDYNYNFDPPRLVSDVWKSKTGSQIQRYVYKYDEEGEINIEERYNEEDQLVGYFKIEYDETRENPAKKEWYGPDNQRRSYFINEFDAFGNTTKVELHDGSGALEATQVFTYDSTGNLVEEKWFDPEGKLMKHLKY